MNFAVLILIFVQFDSMAMGKTEPKSLSTNELTLEAVRDSLIRQEDTIIFNLIERAKFPLNSPTYDQSYASIPGFSGSLIQFIVKETEAIQARAGRYQNPEEHPFSPGDLPPSIVPQYKYPVVLNPAAASINFNSKIWDFYLNQVIPSLAVAGNNGEYALTASSDLNCLQAISRRIHYGNFVAEVKFRDAPHEYETTIRAQDRDALMKLLTFESVEEMILKRVEKKAMTFGQEVNLGSNVGKPKYKLDPAVVSQLYKQWIIPLTKLVQVEYLLRRLD